MFKYKLKHEESLLHLLKSILVTEFLALLISLFVLVLLRLAMQTSGVSGSLGEEVGTAVGLGSWSGGVVACVLALSSLVHDCMDLYLSCSFFSVAGSGVGSADLSAISIILPVFVFPTEERVVSFGVLYLYWTVVDEHFEYDLKNCYWLDAYNYIFHFSDILLLS